MSDPVPSSSNPRPALGDVPAEISPVNAPVVPGLNDSQIPVVQPSDVPPELADALGLPPERQPVVVNGIEVLDPEPEAEPIVISNLAPEKVLELHREGHLSEGMAQILLQHMAQGGRAELVTEHGEHAGIQTDLEPVHLTGQQTLPSYNGEPNQVYTLEEMGRMIIEQRNAVAAAASADPIAAEEMGLAPAIPTAPAAAPETMDEKVERIRGILAEKAGQDVVAHTETKHRDVIKVEVPENATSDEMRAAAIAQIAQRADLSDATKVGLHKALEEGKVEVVSQMPAAQRPVGDGDPSSGQQVPDGALQLPYYKPELHVLETPGNQSQIAADQAEAAKMREAVQRIKDNVEPGGASKMIEDIMVNAGAENWESIDKARIRELLTLRQAGVAYIDALGVKSDRARIHLLNAYESGARAQRELDDAIADADAEDSPWEELHGDTLLGLKIYDRKGNPSGVLIASDEGSLVYLNGFMIIDGKLVTR